VKRALGALLVCLLPLAAAAQDGVAAADMQNSGPMVVQPVHNTFIVAPDFKLSRFDGTTAALVGVYGGWLLDQQWLIGAGGYWLANGSDGRGLAYGGGVFGWSTSPARTIGFSARSLIGWGEASIPGTMTGLPPLFSGYGLPYCRGILCPPGPFPLPRYPVVFHEGFFVAEPQADLLRRVASWGRLDVGAGYRAPAGANGFERQIRGATASVSLQVGNF
jgi:hypothetical protein